MTEPIPAQSSEYKTACGDKLKDPTNYPGADYRDEQVYFCAHTCLRLFEQAPDAFMAGEVEHPLEED